MTTAARSKALASAFALTLVALAGAALAADGDKPTYELGLYVWGAMVAGDIDTREGEASMHIPFSDVLDNLNMAIMARGRANFGKASIVADFEYLDLQADKQQHHVRLGPEGNIEVSASSEAQLETYIAELNGGYEVLNVKGPFSAGPGDERGTVAELYAGGRYYSMKPDVVAKALGQRRDIGERNTWVDAVVGARIGIDLSRTVVFGIQGDVGGFNIGNSNKFAWSQITSLSWDFADNMTFALGYKFLDIKRESGDREFKVQLRGPFVATFFRF